jgi:hypothetical protein
MPVVDIDRLGLPRSGLRVNCKCPGPLKHLRYPLWKPKDNQVTIALGILAHDSVVIAADTQMTYPDYLKTGQGKIAWLRKTAPSGQLGGLAITGAGSGAYLQHLQREFISRFSNNADLPTVDDLRQDLKTRMHEFYRDHVVPFSQYGAAERPDVWLIMGYRDRDKATLGL